MKKILGFIFYFLIFSACKTDFEVNSTWKETTVIYGLLDQSQKVQMIKINKGFLGEGNANQFAQNTDSINYNPAELEVILTETKNGVALRIIPFHDSIIQGKKSGAFTTIRNIIYVSYEKLDSLDFTKVYKLTVRNLKTGNIASASTSLLEKAIYIKPNKNCLVFTDVPSTPLTNGAYFNLVTSWISKPNAKIYQTNMRIYYSEKDIYSNQKVDKFIDWLQLTKNSTKIAGGEQMTQDIEGRSFYQLLASEIPENPNMVRHAKQIVFTLTVGSDELSKYILITEPSGDLNQDKPVYTNIENGLGLFSARTSYSVVRYLCNDTILPHICGCNSSTLSVRELVEGKYTAKLNFQYN